MGQGVGHVSLGTPLVNESFILCVPCRIFMLNKMIFAKLLILCAQCDLCVCVCSGINQIFSLNYSITFELLHNLTFVAEDDNEDVSE